VVGVEAGCGFGDVEAEVREVGPKAGGDVGFTAWRGVEEEEAEAVLVGEGVLEMAFARDQLALEEAGLQGRDEADADAGVAEGHLVPTFFARTYSRVVPSATTGIVHPLSLARGGATGSCAPIR